MWETIFFGFFCPSMNQTYGNFQVKIFLINGGDYHSHPFPKEFRNLADHPNSRKVPISQCLINWSWSHAPVQSDHKQRGLDDHAIFWKTKFMFQQLLHSVSRKCPLRVCCFFIAGLFLMNSHPCRNSPFSGSSPSVFSIVFFNQAALHQGWL